MNAFLMSMMVAGVAGLDLSSLGLGSCKSALRKNLKDELIQVGFNNKVAATILPAKDCIIKLRDELGISSDLAFLECRERAINSELEAKKNRFKLCTQVIQGTPKILKPVRKYKGGYLVDLGPYGFRTPENFWKEGGWWRKNGCTPIKEMEHWTKDNIETAQRHRWFRYGKCSSRGITLGVWSEVDALNYCNKRAK